MKKNSGELRQLVGQLVIVGVEGPALAATERAWLRLIRPAGVILFRRNIEDPQQTHGLLTEVTEVLGTTAFRCVDVEGGLVDRLRDAVAPMPSAAAVAMTGKRKLFRRHGELIAREVQALGFNVTLAPVLDLGLPESRSVMRTRTASADPRQVIEYAEAFLDGLNELGIVGCGKHFPGLGGGNLDSHLQMPVIERSGKEMWTSDLLPYRRLAKRLPIVMISHGAFPGLGGDPTPASVSSHVIRDVLRSKIGYSGLVLSDDMEMGGILSHVEIESAATAAVLAGTDLIEICKDPELVLRAYEALLSESERSPSFRKGVTVAATRVARMKQKMLQTMPAKAPAPKLIDRLRRDIARLAAVAPEPNEASAEPIQA